MNEWLKNNWVKVLVLAGAGVGGYLAYRWWAGRAGAQSTGSGLPVNKKSPKYVGAKTKMNLLIALMLAKGGEKSKSDPAVQVAALTARQAFAKLNQSEKDALNAELNPQLNMLAITMA